MICSCGKETETRVGILDIGFIHGCWDEAHMEFMDIDGHEVYDLFPITGDEKETEEQAIKSHKEWTK
jgi:hypothetical protein